MTCKDCLHYEVCYYHDFEGCEWFSDKSKCVHLPCKVGDTVYKLWYAPCHLGETCPNSYGCGGCYDECDIKKVITEYKVPSLRFIVDELMSDNCIYYLTRKEAEEALEEKKNK